MRLWFDCALGSLHMDPSVHMLLRACLSLPVMCWKCNTEMNHSLPSGSSVRQLTSNTAHRVLSLNKYMPQPSILIACTSESSHTTCRLKLFSVKYGEAMRMKSVLCSPCGFCQPGLHPSPDLMYSWRFVIILQLSW